MISIMELDQVNVKAKESLKRFARTVRKSPKRCKGDHYKEILDLVDECQCIIDEIEGKGQGV
jgi:hypothetical protein